MEPLEFARTFGCATVLDHQDGIIRRDQAVACGYSPGRIDGFVRRGTWTSLLPGIYQVASSPGWRTSVRAAWLWGGEDSVITGLAAAAWLGHLRWPGGPITLALPVNQPRRTSANIRVERARIGDQDIRHRDGILVTHANRTALDLAAVGNTDLLDLMLRDKWFRLEQLQKAMERGRGRRGWTTARQALIESATNPHSAAERLAHRIFLANGITGWVANSRLALLGRNIFPDILFLGLKLVVEIDGYEFHGGREAFEADRERRALLIAAGYQVIEFTWRQLQDTAYVIRVVRAAIAEAKAA